MARPRGYSEAQKGELQEATRKVLAEVGREDMPVLADIDIGHTSPMMTLPLGCRVSVDASDASLELLEPAVL